MPLNLSLNGWPPLASHMSCLLLGVSLTHLSWREPPPSLRVPAESLLFSLPVDWERRLADVPAFGSRVHLVLKQASGARCRLDQGSMTLVATQPRPVLTTDYATGFALLAQLKDVDIKHSGAELPMTRLSNELPLCTAKPKVSYGPA